MNALCRFTPYGSLLPYGSSWYLFVVFGWPQLHVIRRGLGDKAELESSLSFEEQHSRRQAEKQETKELLLQILLLWILTCVGVVCGSFLLKRRFLQSKGLVKGLVHRTRDHKSPLMIKESHHRYSHAFLVKKGPDLLHRMPHSQESVIKYLSTHGIEQTLADCIGKLVKLGLRWISRNKEQ